MWRCLRLKIHQHISTWCFFSNQAASSNTGFLVPCLSVPCDHVQARPRGFSECPTIGVPQAWPLWSWSSCWSLTATRSMPVFCSLWVVFVDLFANFRSTTQSRNLSDEGSEYIFFEVHVYFSMEQDISAVIQHIFVRFKAVKTVSSVTVAVIKLPGIQRPVFPPQLSTNELCCLGQVT